MSDNNDDAYIQRLKNRREAVLKHVEALDNVNRLKEELIEAERIRDEAYEEYLNI